MKFLRHTKLPAILLCGILLSAGTARAAWYWPFGNDGIDYSVKIYGVDKETKDWISSLKIDQKNEVTPPKDVNELKQESVSVAERLKKALDAHGFYDAVINQKVVKKDDSQQLVYNITPGPRYRLSKITLQWQGKPVKPIKISELSIHEKMPVDVAAIQKDAALLLNRIGNDSCLLSLTVNPLLQLHGTTHTAVLVYRITHGPKVNFGKTRIVGTKDVDNVVILRAVDWKQGQCYQEPKLETTRTTLIQNQLFASVKVEPDTKADQFGEVPITISVRERVPRTISAGANYSTDQGFGVTGGWEHRNYFGKGEKFNVDASIAQQEQFLNTALRLPAFMRDDQTLVLSNGIKHEEQDAYTSSSISPAVTIERKLSPHLNSGLGVAYTITKTDDLLAGKSNYGLLSFPGFLTYDTRDSTIDPRKGLLGNLTVTPYTETFGDGGQFLKTQTSLQTYFSSDKFSLKPTLALKAALGSIAGADGKNVPSDIRFYAGGGGSVRGYEYQSLSPQLNGESVGGSSMVTGTAELRLRFNESFGGVAFIDAGNAYDENFPSLGEKLYYGAGIGVRYYTAVGPLRIDIATPLNGKDIDQTGYALYVSVGQAF